MLTQDNRALTYWYNIVPSDVYIREILGQNISVKPGHAQTLVLDIVFDPSQRGIYNTGQLSTNLKENWGGLFRHIPAESIKDAQSKNLIMMVWMKILDAPTDAVLNIDLGQISEDIIPNGKLDAEVKTLVDLVSGGKDTGIDELMDSDETGYNATTNSDPNNDDYHYYVGSGDYSHLNGQEGNSVSIDFEKVPNTEDLNRNSVLDKSNNYYSYTIPLDTNKIIQNMVVERCYGDNRWFKIKIPVDLPDVKVGTLDKSKLETIRLWITNSNQKVHLRIAEIKFAEF
jgi:hypothetical protein